MTRNATSFGPGPDPRRHAFTANERRRGGRNSTGRVPFRRGADPRRRKFTRAECREAGRKGFAATMAAGKAAGKIKARIYAHYGKNGNGHLLLTEEARRQSARLKREAARKRKRTA